MLTDSPPIPVEGPFVSRFVPENLDELRAIEFKALGRIAASRDLEYLHPGLRQLMKREQKQREKYSASGYDWNKPKFDNPFDQRRLRLLNGLFLALAKRDHSGDAYELDGELHGRALVGDTHIGLMIEPVGKQKSSPARGYRSLQDLPASTPLAISIDSSFRRTADETWQDDQDGKLETKLAAIAAGVIGAGEATFRRRLRERQEWLEEVRQRDEQRRLEQLAALEAERLGELRRIGDLLHEAEDNRAILSRSLGSFGRQTR